MRRGGRWARGFAWAVCALAAMEASAQGLNTQAAKNWAWDQVKAGTYYHKDARGQTIWGKTFRFFDLTYAEQTKALLDRLSGSDADRRSALIVLGDRPLDQWAKAALARANNRDEVALFLYGKGYKQADKDPYAYLEPAKELGRPWTQGLGLHLDGGNTWHFQWISSPVILPKLDAADRFPKGLGNAPQPGILLHLKQLRPGLSRLRALAGDGTASTGIVSTLANGRRLGFYLRHADAWLKNASAALEPLANREAWVLHYGLSRDGMGPSEGTLIYLPGDLPTRTQLVLDLLKLNPTSLGARSRGTTWTGPGGATAQITQVRGSGGVLSIYATPEGTWISDKEAPLRAVAFPAAAITLSERAEWCKVAMAGIHADTEASLWIAPRQGAGAEFERLVLRRRQLNLQGQTWNNPFIAKAAARGGDISLSLGAGPTSDLVGSILRVDDDSDLEEPKLPTYANNSTVNPEQLAAFQKECNEIRQRNRNRKAMRAEVESLKALLDLRGAALYWKGWVEAPPLTQAQLKAQAELQALKKEGPYQAARRQYLAEAGCYGGFGEPGMSPSVALALSLQSGKDASAEAILRKLWPRLFKGRTENREIAKGVVLHRVRTEQAFTPCYAIVNGQLLLGSDDKAVQAMASSLLGQGPSLADYQSKAYGIAELDGPGLAKELEILLLSYLRINQNGRYWWFGEPSPTDDEAAAELASTFGPFLGALKTLGSQTLELEWNAGGMEARQK